MKNIYVGKLIRKMPKKKVVKSFITDLRSRKILCRQKIPDSIFARKETVDIDIPITSRNCDKNATY